MTEFSRTDAEHDQEQFYPGELPAALHGSPQIQCLSTVGSLSAAEKDTDKVIIMTLRLPKAYPVWDPFSRQISLSLLLLSQFHFVSYSTILSYLIRAPRINSLEAREPSVRHSIRYYWT